MVASYARFLECQARRRLAPPRNRGLRRGDPSGCLSLLTGLRHTVYEHPITHRFAVIRLPEGFVRSHAIPLRPGDRWFDTRDEAVADLQDLLDRDESSEPDVRA